MAEATTVERVQAGDHACLTFTDPDERLDIIAAFIRDGLAGGHRVVCLTDSIAPPHLPAELGRRGVACESPLRRGQLQVVGSDEAWLAGGTGAADKMIGLLADEVDRAAQDGYDGLRVTADMAWAARPLADPESLGGFEVGVAGLFADGRLTAICQYDREVFDPVTLAFAARTHPKTVAAQVYHDDALLRVCRQYSPPGIRVAGEIDYRHLDVFGQALAEAIRLDHHVHLNLRQLRLCDATIATAIVRAAMTLAHDRRMTVVCPPLVRRVLDLCGAVDVDRLRVSDAP